MRAILARWSWPAALAACLAGAGLASIGAGLDVNWDLKNYHYYDAYAFLNGRLAWDVAPAQIQTYHNPLLDLVFYALVQEIPSPRVIAFLMALPAGIAAFLLLRMSDALFPRGQRGRALWIAAAFAIGVTGASGRAVIGSTMNEWQPAMLLTIALAVLTGSIARRASPPFAAIALAGFAAGLAAGLKLTYGVFAVALVVAVASFGTLRERAWRASATGAFLLVGTLLTYGFWGATLWSEFGNPFFPYFNDIFKSPWWEPVAWFDRRFGPRDLVEGILFPIALTRESTLVGEVEFRDWRLATLMVLAIGAAVRFAIERRKSPPIDATTSRPWIFLGVFALTAYLVWLKLYAIYRYLVPLELISGPLIVGCLLVLVRGHIARCVVVVVLAGLIVGTTRPASWGRLPFRGAYFDVAVPDLAPRALVIVGTFDPFAYAIPFVRPDARFVRPQSNFLDYTQRNLLAQKIEKLVAGHTGPIYVLDMHGLDRDAKTLAHFGLARDAASCLPIRSYLDWSSMEICRLERVRP